MSNDSWENSPEYDTWVQSGERDEDRSHYYNLWNKRVQTELLKG